MQVFFNPSAALFHPKVARFEYPDGQRCMIVGSGNLTLGGLRQNFEAFSVTRAAEHETLDVSSWDRFLGRHVGIIRDIDEEALERASRNLFRRRRRRDVESEPGAWQCQIQSLLQRQISNCLLGAPIAFLLPVFQKAGSRWHQVHFNIAVIEQFFRVQHDTAQRVYLVECRQDGTFAEPEVRPCIYSRVNMNPKIEIASHRAAPYPDAGQPIAIYRELQARSFAYMLLLPGDPGYDGCLI